MNELIYSLVVDKLQSKNYILAKLAGCESTLEASSFMAR
jgi:hypothetical protein